MLKNKIIPIVIAAFLFGLPCGISPLAEEVSTESIGETTDEISEAINAQMAQVREQTKQVKEKMKAVKGQKENVKKAMEKFIEEMRKHKLDFSDIAESLSNMAIEIPEIVMEIPPIPPIPPIKMPKMPYVPPIGGINSSLKDFKGETVAKKFDKTFETNEKTRLIAHGPFASLVIVPAEPGQSLRAEVELIAGAPDKDEAQKLLDEMEVSFESKDDELTITAPPMKDHTKDDNQRIKACKVKLFAPALASIELKNQFGDVLIESVSTNIQCENEFGSLDVKNVRGELDLKNKFGSLIVVNHIGDGKLRCEFGGPTIDGWSGKMDLDVQFGQSDISGLTKEAEINGKFSFGAVNLKLPTDYAGEIKASASMGSIKAPEGLKEKKEMMSNSVSGVIGEGKGRINLKCSFSEVTIVKE
ncbi:MAG: DUF4097 family beta strand repeat-containing protein [Candidatus Omnitrophota bacterium]